MIKIFGEYVDANYVSKGSLHFQKIQVEVISGFRNRETKMRVLEAI